MSRSEYLKAMIRSLFLALPICAWSADRPEFRFAQIEPIFGGVCYDCHDDGVSKGDLAFDEFENEAALTSD